LPQVDSIFILQSQTQTYTSLMSIAMVLNKQCLPNAVTVPTTKGFKDSTSVIRPKLQDQDQDQLSNSKNT